MIGLLPLGRIVGVIAISYGVVVTALVLIISKISTPLSFVDGLKVATLGGLPIQLLLLLWINVGWRRLWRVFPALNRWVFPDIGGVWSMEIDWVREQTSGTLEARVEIKQTFTHLSMDVEAPGSDSRTLSAVPKKDPESGRPSIHYLYLVTPHARGAQVDPPYLGAAILRFSEAGEVSLSGNYWTSAMTKGHYFLKRII